MWWFYCRTFCCACGCCCGCCCICVVAGVNVAGGVGCYVGIGSDIVDIYCMKRQI